MDKTIRQIAHGTAWFKDDSRIVELMKFQCSATRSAYQAIHKHNIKENDIKIYVKKNYMKDLNQRYIADACSSAKGIIHESSLFGGKKLWDRLIKKHISKDEWQQIRNNHLYSRGDKTKNGNPNIRIIGNKIFVNDTSKRGLWIEGKIWIPKKFKLNLECYDVRLIKKNNKYEVRISWEENIPKKIEFQEGMIGIDCNPDGIAVSETDSSGNLLNHFYLKNTRIKDARKEKRDYDIFKMAKEVVNYAIEKKKRISLEKLSFKKENKYRKFNRMSNNFAYRKLLEAIYRRAIKNGIEVINIIPAFTSTLGRLKYQKMYSLDRHSSAALVIARRAQEFKERKDFKVKKDEKKKDVFNLEGRGISIALTQKAWSWLQKDFLKPNTTILTGSNLAADLEESVIRFSMSENLIGESISITGRYGELGNSSLMDNNKSNLLEDGMLP